MTSDATTAVHPEHFIAGALSFQCTIPIEYEEKTIPGAPRACTPRNVVRAFLLLSSRLQFRPRVSYHVALGPKVPLDGVCPGGSITPLVQCVVAGASGCLLRYVVPLASILRSSFAPL